MKLTDLKKVTSIKELSALLEYNSSLVLVSPLPVWDINKRNFRRNPSNTLVKIFKNDKGELFFDHMGMFHNIESFLRGTRGSEITNKEYYSLLDKEVSIEEVIKVLNYLVNKKVNFYVFKGDSYFSPEVKENLKSMHKKSSESFQNLVNFFTTLDDRKHEVYDKKGNFKYKNFNNTYILRNTSHGSDVFYWMIGETFYQLGGTHIALTDKRLSTSNDRWKDGMSSSNLTWSNWYNENGYNRSFSIKKGGVKNIKIFNNLVEAFLKLCTEANTQKSIEMKNLINGLVKLR